MARITWLGDAECIWNDVTFPAGVPVEITDAYMLGKARNSPFFKVETDVSFFDDPPVQGSCPKCGRTHPKSTLPIDNRSSASAAGRRK